MWKGKTPDSKLEILSSVNNKKICKYSVFCVNENAYVYIFFFFSETTSQHSLYQTITLFNHDTSQSQRSL